MLKGEVMSVFVIEDIKSAEVLDSRGVPTVACQVTLDGGAVGFMQVPSGASTGQYEAVELRDGDSERYFGKGVRQAVSNIEQTIKPQLVGKRFSSLSDLDKCLCELDSCLQKSLLGANTLLSISGAFAKAAAVASRLPLYRFFSSQACTLPVPLMNVINGGRHADNNLAIQEFMLVPHGFNTFSESVRAGAEVTQHLGEVLASRYASVGRGDEGGFAPDMHDSREALDAILLAIDRSSFGIEQIGIALDIAASEYCNGQGYFLNKSGDQVYGQHQWVQYISSLIDSYPIVSIEDIASDTDFSTWRYATQQLSERVQIVGDDVFVTQQARLQQGIDNGIANAVLLKPNQVGSLTEMISTMDCALRSHYQTIISHRSGETEDALIADIAVGLSCQQIKSGPLRQSDRLSKYNRLLWIERELGSEAKFAASVYNRFSQVLV